MICRMCLLETSNALSIFEDDSGQYKIATTIAKHFWFEPLKDDPISNMICHSCWSKIEDFHVYYVSVEEAQWNLPKISSIKEESSVQAVYLKVESPISDVEIRNTELGGATAEIEKVDVSQCSFDDSPNTFADSTICDIDDDFNSSSDDEILANRISTDKSIKSEGTVPLETNNLKLQNESIESKISDTDADHSEEKLTQKKRGRKKKSETVIQQPSVEEYRKKSKKSDEEIAQQTKLKCDLCISEFTIFSQLQRHYRAVHNRKGYVVCCTKKFFKRGLFLDHISQHVNPERFKCDECNKIYANRHTLQSHVIIRHSADIKIYQCDQCPRSFAKQYLLNHHKLNIHAPKDVCTFFCEECGKGFNTNNSLQNHRRCIHENAYAQICHICAKVIRGKTLFAKHQLEHAGITEPKQQCKECGVWIKNAFRLKLHMKKHTETEKEHICSICGKSSPSSMALQSHIRYVHSAKRQHQCSYCEKAFKKALTLKEHITTHTGGILYTCPHCPKTFNSRSNMHSHRKKVHREEWEEARKNRGVPPGEMVYSKEDDAKSNAANDTQANTTHDNRLRIA